jgi:Ino eighty subunit 2
MRKRRCVHGTVCSSGRSLTNCVQMETINKLLSKPAPKRRTRAEMIAAQQAADLTSGAEDDEGRPRANPHFARWVNNKNGSRVAVPDEWLEGPIGEVFKLAKTASNGGAIVQEVA